jgi:hypothetical protein
MEVTTEGIILMPRLKPLLAILPFIFAGLGAFALAGMLTAQTEMTRLPKQKGVSVTPPKAIL